MINHCKAWEQFSDKNNLSQSAHSCTCVVLLRGKQKLESVPLITTFNDALTAVTLPSFRVFFGLFRFGCIFSFSSTPAPFPAASGRTRLMFVFYVSVPHGFISTRAMFSPAQWALVQSAVRKQDVVLRHILSNLNKRRQQSQFCKEVTAANVELSP